MSTGVARSRAESQSAKIFRNFLKFHAELLKGFSWLRAIANGSKFVLNHDQRDLLVPQFELNKNCLLDNFEIVFFARSSPSKSKMFQHWTQKISNFVWRISLPLITKNFLLCAINQKIVRIELEILLPACASPSPFHVPLFTFNNNNEIEFNFFRHLEENRKKIFMCWDLHESGRWKFFCPAPINFFFFFNWWLTTNFLRHEQMKNLRNYIEKNFKAWVWLNNCIILSIFNLFRQTSFVECENCVT